MAQTWRGKGCRVVFTNGVFDIIHSGHVELLTKAKSWGDILVVGINSDLSTRRLKGASRPINSQRDRARVLAALKPVDFVCIFPEDTPLNLIKAIRPDVLVKGSEYTTGTIVGADEVRSWKGIVRRFRMKLGYSTSAIERRILGGSKSTPRHSR
ncbi:MAG: adenylyltransferase/cytidyltransferase family protein [candidate division Zixibacteria bacterium]|nr:adenylyltransferase/cytidyltransferase family protein [candidate division Zixibacteria bacterium]